MLEEWIRGFRLVSPPQKVYLFIDCRGGGERDRKRPFLTLSLGVQQ